MALGTDHMQFADLDNFIPEIWGARINDYFRYELKLASFFTDRSEELLGGGDTLNTPDLVAFSTNDKSGEGEVTLQTPTYTTKQLVVSTWKEASFLIEDREMKQLKQSYVLQEQLARGGAYEVAQELETAIATLFSGFSQATGASSTNLADSDLLLAIATLETNGVPGIYSGDVAWVLHPNTFYRQIGIVDKFTLWQNTSSESPRMTPPTPMLYGIPVIVSPSVGVTQGSRRNALVHRDAIHWARLNFDVPAGVAGYVGESGVRVMQSYEHSYLGTLVTMDLCYGVVENRDNAAVLLRSTQTVV